MASSLQVIRECGDRIRQEASAIKPLQSRTIAELVVQERSIRDSLEAAKALTDPGKELVISCIRECLKTVTDELNRRTPDRHHVPGLDEN